MCVCVCVCVCVCGNMCARFTVLCKRSTRRKKFFEGRIRNLRQLKV